MKILLSGWWGGEHPGSLVTLIRLARPLIYLGYKVTAFSTCDHVDVSDELALESKIIGDKNPIKLLLQYKKLIGDYDVLYSFSYHRLLTPYLIKDAIRLPKFLLDLNVDTVDGIKNPLIKNFVKKIIKASKVITTPSSYYKQYLMKNWKIKPDKIKHVYYSVDDNLFVKESDERKYRTLDIFDLNPSLKTIIHTGQVNEFQMKVYLELMRFNINLLMIGPDLNRQEVTEFVNLLERKFPKRFRAIRRYIPYNKILQILKASDLFIVYYGRYMTGHPQKLYDYLAAGKPVIVNEAPGIKDIVNDENAVLIENKGEVIKKYVEAASEILQDENKATIIGDKARDFALKNFKINTVAEKLKNILEK